MSNIRVLEHEDKQYWVDLFFYTKSQDGCLLQQGDDSIILDDGQLRKLYEELKERYA